MDKEFESRAELLFKAFSTEISQMPNAYPQMLIVLDFILGPSKEVIIVGEKEAKGTPQMINGIYKKFIPNKVVAFRAPSGKEAEAVVGLIPFLKEQRPLEGKTTVYVCTNYVCALPTTSTKRMQELLED